MRLSFPLKLILSYLIIVATTLAIAGLLLERRWKRHQMQHFEGSLLAQARLCANALDQNAWRRPSEALQRLVIRFSRDTGLRLTVIRKDGVVLADSSRSLEEVGRMGNHRGRPEVERAFALGTGQSIRYSTTLGSDLLYVAAHIGEKTPPEGIVRVAIPLQAVFELREGLRLDLLRAGGAALLLAMVMAWWMARRVTHPLERLLRQVEAIRDGRSPGPVPSAIPSDEFERLEVTANAMAVRIADTVQELSREKAQLATILSAMVEAVLAVDHQGRILLLNPAAELLFEVRLRDAQGRSFLEVLRQSLLIEVIQEAQARQPASREITLLPAERVLSVLALPIDFGQGETGVLAVLHDITELRRLATIRQDFVANVSHELRTPLTSIKGYVETLLDGAIDDKSHNREFLKIIQDHTENLTRLVDDLLDLSRIEARRMPYHFEPVSAAEVAARVLKTLEPMARQAGVALHHRISAALPRIRADADRLAQILSNLVDNAIKFNYPDGSVILDAHVEGEHLELSVTDTGMGIPPEDLPRIFERFFRADRSHSHDIKGTGLGLAIVKHLVESHGGRVWAENAPARGTTFRFTLPLASLSH